jgi:hypothetical protein
MNFFCTKEHFDAYATTKNLKDADAYCLSLPFAVEAARYIFSN